MPAREGGVSEICRPAGISPVHFGALSLYVRLSQAFGTGMMQMFIERLSSESIAD
jgi:hypothetical protein